MARAETTVSPVPAGAGRFADWMWPDPLVNTGVNISTSARVRNGSSATNTVTVGATAIGVGTQTIAAVVNGIDCAQILADNVGNATWYGFSSAGVLNIRTTKSAIPASCDDRLCYRIIFNAAASGIAVSAAQDCGIEISHASAATGGVIANATPGFGLRFTATTVDFITRGNNGLIQQTLFTQGVGGFDMTAWHSYEMRIVGATAQAEATLAVLTDGVPTPLAAASSSWGAGTNLQPSALIGGRMGFVTRWGFTGGAFNNGLFVQSVRVIAAPSLADTL